MENINLNQFDYKKIVINGQASLKSAIEKDDESWLRWTTSDKRYLLVTNINLIEDSFDKTNGKVMDNFEMYIYSNSIESLRNIWNNLLLKKSYDTTSQHFIADTSNKKIIEFLSICV